MNTLVHAPRRALLLPVFVLCVAGCQQRLDPPLPVTGSVLWDDGAEAHDLDGGTVEFESNGTVAAKAQLQSDGTFASDAPLPEGSYRVRVLPPAGPPKPKAAGQATYVLDPSAQKFETSGLTATGSAEPQAIVLRVKGRKVAGGGAAQQQTNRPSWD